MVQDAKGAPCTKIAQTIYDDAMLDPHDAERRIGNHHYGCVFPGRGQVADTEAGTDAASGEEDGRQQAASSRKRLRMIDRGDAADAEKTAHLGVLSVSINWCYPYTGTRQVAWLDSRRGAVGLHSLHS